MSQTMSPWRFKQLAVGDTVTLAKACKVYGCGFDTSGGQAYIAAGTQGTVGAVNVPTVTGKPTRGGWGKARYFVCVDFPPETALVDDMGNTFGYQNRHNNSHRVAAFPAELQSLPRRKYDYTKRR